MTKQKNLFLAWLLICLSATFFSYAQQQTAVYANVSDGVKAFYRYEPEGYPAAGVKYPLIIFVHGFGERGPGTAASLPLVLRNGIPRLINDGNFPTSFTVAGQTYRFMVISPQFAETGFPSVNDINRMIDYALANYPVDINRIYLTGLSMGGGVSWYYPGYNSYFASRIAATVPVCGAVDNSVPAQQAYANIIAAGNVPVWATHNRNDPQVEVTRTENMVRFINERPNPPNPLAKKTIFEVGGHDAWTQTYNPNFRENGLNIYEWMLQYRRSIGVLPVAGLNFTAQQISNARRVQLKWSTTAEINVEGFRILRSNDGVNFTSIGFVNAAGQGGNGTAYTYVDEYPLAGKDFYRLEIKELSGAVNLSEIRQVNLEGYSEFVISPNPVKETMNLQTSSVITNASMQIFNSNGQLIATKLINGSGNIVVKMGNIPPGMYVAKITEREKIIQLKFVKE